MMTEREKAEAQWIHMYRSIQQSAGYCMFVGEAWPAIGTLEMKDLDLIRDTVLNHMKRNKEKIVDEIVFQKARAAKKKQPHKIAEDYQMD